MLDAAYLEQARKVQELIDRKRAADGIDPTPARPVIQLEQPKQAASGQELLDQRRAEYVFNHPPAVRPDYHFERPKQEIPPQTPTAKAEKIRVRAAFYFAARSETGKAAAWRLWTLARYLDKPGCGWVERRAMRAALASWGINGRTARHMLKQAELFQLVKPGADNRLYLAGACKVAALLEAQKAGIDVFIPLSAFVGDDWRAAVWIAFEACQPEGIPRSQRVKREISGVPERTQRRHLARLRGGVTKRRNYATLGTETAAAINSGTDDPRQFKRQRAAERGKVVFKTRSGRELQRLPDITQVNNSLAEKARPGMSKKIQRVCSALYNADRANGKQRIFYQTYKAMTEKLREAGKRGAYELFSFDRAFLHVNYWNSDPVV